MAVGYFRHELYIDVSPYYEFIFLMSHVMVTHKSLVDLKSILLHKLTVKEKG